MNNQPPAKPFIELFSGAAWPQRSVWRSAARLLPPNAWVVVVEDQNLKLAPVLQKIIDRLAESGHAVYGWFPPGSQRPDQQQISFHRFKRRHHGNNNTFTRITP